MRYLKGNVSVSIHAPTWGATVIVLWIYSVVQVSIHAPTWGATPVLPDMISSSERFNPRSHVGSDPVLCSQIRFHCSFNPRSHVGSDSPKGEAGLWTNVSIHTPTQGATHIYTDAPRFYMFQSTLPCGERRRAFGVNEAEKSFNPHSHVGSDHFHPSGFL